MSTSVITIAGLAAAAAAGSSGPQIRVAYAKLGSAIITPNESMTDVSSPVYTVPANRISYQVIDQSTVMFSIDLDNTIGDFLVGNFAFFLDDNTMFCITALPAQDSKRATTVSQVGNGRRYQQVINLSGMATISDLTLIVPDEAALPEVPTEVELPAASAAPYPVYLVRAHSAFNGRPVLACRYSGQWWWAPTVDSSGGNNGLIFNNSMFASGISDGTCVYLDTTGPTPIFRAADGNDQAKKPVGIKGSGNSIYTPGSIYTSTGTPYTVNATYYCAGTTGALTSTETSAPIGLAIAANKIYVSLLAQGSVVYNNFTVVGSTSSALDLENKSNSTNEKTWRWVNTTDYLILRAMSDDKTTFQDAYIVDRNGTNVLSHTFNAGGSAIAYIDSTGLVASTGKRIVSSRYEFKDYPDSWSQVGNTSYLQQFDAGDYLNYDKKNNTYFWLIANTVGMKLYAASSGNSGGLSIENNRNVYVDTNNGYFWNSLASGIFATASAMTTQWDVNDYVAYSKSENSLKHIINNNEIFQVNASGTTNTASHYTITNTTTAFKGFRFEQSGYGLYSNNTGQIYLGDINNITASYYYSYKDGTVYKHGIYNQIANKNLIEFNHDTASSGYSSVTIRGDLLFSGGNPANANYPRILLNPYFGLITAFNIANVADNSPLLQFTNASFIAYHTGAQMMSFYVRDTDKGTIEARGMLSITRGLILAAAKMGVSISVASEPTISRRTSNFTNGDFTPEASHFHVASESVQNGGGTAIGFLTNQLGTGTYGCRVGVDSQGLFRIGGGSFGSNAFYMNSSGNVTIQGTLTQSSDRRLKSDIKPLQDALHIILNLYGKRYIKDGVAQIGFIAQEVEKWLPEFVTEGRDGMKSVNYAGMTAVLVEGFKSLEARIKKLEGK